MTHRTKEGQTHKCRFLWTTTHRYTSVGRQARIYLHQLCADIGGRMEKLAGSDG